MSGGTSYLEHDRGDRLHPGRFHPRHHVLTRLGARLQAVIDGLPAGTRALDFGCGARPYEPLLRRRFAACVAADLDGNAAADLVLDPAGRLPVDAETFDCVLSSQVLEHVASPEHYLAEARRVLRPGGVLVLSTHGLWMRHPDPADYWRWTADGLHLALERAGFDVTDMHGVLGPSAAVLQLLQDVSVGWLPRLLRTPCVGLMQLVIGAADRWHGHTLPRDAAVYVVVARRPADTAPASTRGDDA